MKKSDVNILIHACNLYEFEMSRSDNTGDGIILVGNPNHCSKGRAKVRKLKRLINEITGEQIYDVDFLSNKDIDALYKIDFYKTRLYEKVIKFDKNNKDHKRLMKMGLVKEKREYFNGTPRIFKHSKLVPTTKGSNYLWI